MFKLGLIFISLFCISPTFADQVKVVLLRGKASYKPPGRKPILLKRGMIIKKNGLLRTGKTSFLRVRFHDGSLLNLGPSSAMAISHEDKGKPKLVELLKGKLRGVINPKQKPQEGFEHKMIINTRSASMGVRGTDFVVVYNEKNHITSNITLKGEVDLHKKSDEDIYESIREQFDEGGVTLNYGQGDRVNAYHQDLTHHSAKRIPVGHFAGAFPSYEKSISPVRVSDHQLSALQKNN
ncbi:MAG: FecR family protein, partial [Halobacteriovoraceae bacterium]|nr:FecR family protein [Halobacteriovoraceae bacterium]